MTSIKNKLILACLLINASASALADDVNNNTETLASRSLSLTVKSPEHEQTLSASAKSIVAIDALKKLALAPQPRLSREQVIAQRKKELALGKSHVAKKSTQNTHSNYINGKGNFVEFSIYDATSKLYEDFDYDGYYQTFSITFDADLHSSYSGERALVFADLYLSRNGGPWELYYSTDPFVIVDDSTEDAFELLTTLDEGYSTSHYDVLIDLYEVGVEEIVATISSEDLEELYALPLESADRDQYVEVGGYTEIVLGGGSFSVSSLLLVSSVLLMRRKGLNK